MVNFLRVYDPIRIIFLVFLLLVIRLPFLFNGLPITIPELEWMLIGERLTDGWIMYRDMWHYTEPLSAGTYFLIDLLFGRSQTTFQVLSIILIFIQAMLVNFICNSQNFFNERSLLPAAAYIILSSLFFDFFTIPPVLLANTFILIALYYFVIQIRFKLNDEHIFFCGLFIGIAALFYLPTFIFLFVFLIGFILYAATEPRKYLLLIVSFLIPLLICFAYYFLRNSGQEFMYHFLLPLFSLEETQFISTSTFILLLIVPGIALVLSLMAVGAKAFYINYQHGMIRIIVLWLIAGLVTLFFTLRFAPFQIYIIVPPLAILITHFYLLVKSKLIKEAFFWTKLGLILLLNAGILYGFLNRKNPVEFGDLLVSTPRNLPSVDITNKKILVLGDEPSLYKESSLATPYYNWKLSKRHFRNLDKLPVLPAIYQNFVKDLPQVIIDRKNVVPDVFAKLPLLQEKYMKLENENVYVLLNE